MDAPTRDNKNSTLPNGIGLGTAKEKAKAARANLMLRARRVRFAWRVTLIVALISLASIIWLSQTSTLVSIGYDIETLDKKMALMDRQAQAMQSDIAELEQPRRIEKEAREKLGMTEAKKFVYVNIDNVPKEEMPTNNNPKLFPVSNWWRELTKNLPKPWFGSTPSQK